MQPLLLATAHAQTLTQSCRHSTPPHWALPKNIMFVDMFAMCVSLRFNVLQASGRYKKIKRIFIWSRYVADFQLERIPCAEQYHDFGDDLW